MINLKRKLVTAAATTAVLLNALMPLAFADTTIEISGNGEDSNNTTHVSANNSTTVVQSNLSTVINTVYSDANTGKNDANRNTGGDVTINTGDAASTVDLSTKTNVNKADVNNCGGCDGDVKVLISGNGADSDNKVGLKSSADTSIYQNNDALVVNTVDSDANTGKNDANRNTGGDVTIETGNATSDVDVWTAVNANVATVGGSGNGSIVDARIVGNGEDSDNRIWLGLNSPVTVVQDNLATILNTIYADADTGKNDANRNTGGNVTIDTGDADVEVDVDNMANFNAADVDCDCLLGDIKAKISGNGADSENKIKAKLSGDLNVFQGDQEGAGNDAFLDTLVYGDADTGKNDADRNTGSVNGGDPEILTGDADSNINVKNSANANIFGSFEDFHLPGGINFDFHFDLNGLLGHIQLG
ncbi:MAG: hypothetical protein Q7K55_08625 [Candidatus Levybacteria bacterium]|nr:hypothetical protein [Candidatus Levybacteria bacterium]